MCRITENNYNKITIGKNDPVVSFSQTKNKNQFITLKLVGDIVLPRNFTKGTNQKEPKIDNTYLDPLKPYLQGQDLLIGNLEGAITNYSIPRKAAGDNKYSFRSDYKSAEILKDLKFDCLHIANNHTRDFYDQGLWDTRDFCQKNGILAAGLKDEIVCKDIRGVRFSFVGFHYANPEYFNSIHNTEKAVELIKCARENSDVVVVTIHAGAEGASSANVSDKEEAYFREKRGNIYAFSRLLIDHGADLIVTSGPHIVRPIEIYKGKLIAYSLGNFLGYGGAFSRAGHLNYSLILDVTVNASGDFVRGKVIPLVFDSNGIPQYDKKGKIIEIINKLNKTNFPHNTLEIDKTGVLECR